MWPTLPEVGLILFIVLVIYGSGRVGRLGDAVGKALSRLGGKR